MGLSVVVGVGVIAFFFLAFAGLVDREKHKHIRNFLLIISFPLLMIIPGSLSLEQTVCELKLNTTYETYQYGNNFTGYHWDYDTGTAPDGPQTDAYLFHKNITNYYGQYCYTVSNGSRALFTSYALMLLVFVVYVFLLFFKEIIDAFNNLRKKV
jgi:hypothetical protein